MAAIQGILGRKLGMSQYFRPNGTVVPVTAIQAGPCTVTQVKTPETDGYAAVQLGFEPSKRLNKPERGHLKKSGAEPLKHLREFRVDGEVDLEVGASIDVSVFEPGDFVDVVGTSKGKGFAGVVKRHHFAGGPKTHGQSDRHRAPGSVGSGTTPGRVHKGMRMAGHLGNARITVQHLEVIAADVSQNLLLLKGAVPGAGDGLLVIKRAVKSKKKQ